MTTSTTTVIPGDQDIWTTSVYSYAPGGGGPGGGLANDVLEVGGWGDLYYSLLKLDLSGLPKYATHVTLRLYDINSNSGTPTSLSLYRITQDWNWQTQGTGSDHQRLWWADQPNAIPQSASPLPAPTPGSYYYIDITDLYNEWQSGALPNYGIELRPTENNNNFDIFASSRNTNLSYEPTLIITASSMPYHLDFSYQQAPNGAGHIMKGSITWTISQDGQVLYSGTGSATSDDAFPLPTGSQQIYVYHGSKPLYTSFSFDLGNFFSGIPQATAGILLHKGFLHTNDPSAIGDYAEISGDSQGCVIASPAAMNELEGQLMSLSGSKLTDNQLVNWVKANVACQFTSSDGLVQPNLSVSHNATGYVEFDISRRIEKDVKVIYLARVGAHFTEREAIIHAGHGFVPIRIADLFKPETRRLILQLRSQSTIMLLCLTSRDIATKSRSSATRYDMPPCRIMTFGTSTVRQATHAMGTGLCLKSD